MIHDSCPECGGVDHSLRSPGLAQCTSVVRWTEDVEVAEVIQVDDPGLYFNLGIYGTRPETVYRTVQQQRSRVCGHQFELEATMTTIECESGPNNKCGAFAVGKCADCSRPSCRYHSTFVAGRLLCDTCREVIEDAERARAASAAEEALLEKQRADAERARQDQERAEAQRRDQVVARAAYQALPVMTEQDWIALLRGGVEPAGKRPERLERLDAARLIRAAGFKPRRVHVETKAFLGRAWTIFKDGWVVGEMTHKRWIRGDEVTETVWLVLLETGEMRGAIPYKGRLDGYVQSTSGWSPTVEGMKRARRYLQARPLKFTDLH